jgi:hypothetical protein
MGDAFPADDVLAEWVATLSLAFNDLALVATRAEEDANTPFKFFYWTRLLISHFAEVGLYLHETKDVAEVKGFVDSLSETVRKNYESALAAFEARQAELHGIRSHVFHYPELRVVSGKKKKRLMQRVLAAHADSTTLVKLGKVKDARLLFADDIAAEVFQVMTGGDEKFEEVHGEISSATTPLTRFMNAAIEEYLVRRGKAGLTMKQVEPVDDEDWTRVERHWHLIARLARSHRATPWRSPP